MLLLADLEQILGSRRVINKPPRQGSKVTNGLPGFLEKDLRFIFFGGKGGVGKTTSAVAGALVLAERNPNNKILLVSTDPVHSVGDSFDQHIGDRVVPVQGVDHLFAREADAERLLAEFKLKNGPVLAKIADRGTYFDKEDIRSFLELSLPGMDEFMAILELMDLVKARQSDVIIMDTAHSLSDGFGRKIGEEITPLEGIPNLYA